MQIGDSEKEKAATFTVELAKEKLLGFRHVEAEATEECFVEDAAATFNKIGVGEVPRGNTFES